MSDSKKKIYLGEDLVCQTFTDAEEQAKAFDLFGLEQPVVSSNAPASTRPVQQGQVCEFDGVDDYISAAHLAGSETVTSSVGTATPSISAGRIDFTAGKCSNLILSDGTQYNLNHASGTTAFDSSGNGNDGTLQNGAAFVVDNTLPPEADRLNLDGYTDDSGVLKPRDESDPTNDIDGNPLQYSGSVYPRRPEYRNSYAASFDGVDDYISAAHLTGSETVTSSVGTSTPSISAGRVDFTAGTCGNLILSDGTHYTLAEGAGDTVYDISGNGNHGTINNASTGTEGAGFWAGRIDGEANALNNNNGFSRRMLFDGTNDIVEVFDNEAVPAVYQSLSDDITIEAHIWRASSGGSDALNWRVAETVVELRQIGTSAGLGIPFSFGVDGNKMSLGVTDDYTTGSENRQATTTLSRFTPYHIKVVISGDNYEFFLDGVSDGSGTFTTATGDRSVGANSSTLTFGSRSKDSGVRDSNMVNGVIWGAKISTDSGATVIGSWNGYGNTDADWIDQVGSNDGTVNGSPALLRIPADASDPTKGVLGDTLTNPAITDGYNGAETELDAYNIAEGDNPSPATNNNSDLDAIEFGTDFASNDAAFMRLKSSTENDRLITFEDDLTGGDETLAQKYTQ